MKICIEIEFCDSDYFINIYSSKNHFSVDLKDLNKDFLENVIYNNCDISEKLNSWEIFAKRRNAMVNCDIPHFTDIFEIPNNISSDEIYNLFLYKIKEIILLKEII